MLPITSNLPTCNYIIGRLYLLQSVLWLIHEVFACKISSHDRTGICIAERSLTSNSKIVIVVVVQVLLLLRFVATYPEMWFYLFCLLCIHLFCMHVVQPPPPIVYGHEKWCIVCMNFQGICTCCIVMRCHCVYGILNGGGFDTLSAVISLLRDPITRSSCFGCATGEF